MVNLPNPNLLLLVGGGAVAYFIIKELRKAGADLADFGKNLEFPSLPSITIGGTTIGETKVESIFPNIPQTDNMILEAIQEQGGLQGQTNQQIIDLLSGLTPLGTILNPADNPVTPTPIDVILNDPTLTQAQKDELLGIINPITPETAPQLFDDDLFKPEEGEPKFSGKDEDREKFEAGLIDQFGRPIQQPTSEERSDFVFPSDGLEVELPTDPQFGFGGPSFIGGIIRENPVDTLNEVLNLFPELSASQAADFLNEFSGISPTDALRVDPDIINKVANIEGDNIQVPNVSVSDLDAAGNRASCTTCELFGLNCERCQIEGLSNV